MRLRMWAAGIPALLLVSSVLNAADTWGLKRGTPELKSAGALTFGPDDILFIGDARSAAVNAVAVGTMDNRPESPEIRVDDLPKAVAEALGVESAQINDIAVHPADGRVFVSADAAGAGHLAVVHHDGQVARFDLTDVRSAAVTLANAPPDEEVGEGRRRRNNRTESITDLAWYEGRLYVSGLQSGDSPSSVRLLEFPFASNNTGVGIEIFHAAHGRDEDYAAMRTFVPMIIDGKPNLLAAYICTPLVRIPLDDVREAAGQIKGTTVAELGNRNRPLDMFTYKKGDETFVLLSNSARGVMKISTQGLGENSGLSEPVRGGGTAGQAYDTVESWQGVIQMDRVNDKFAVVLVEEDGSQNLRTRPLP